MQVKAKTNKNYPYLIKKITKQLKNIPTLSKRQVDKTNKIPQRKMLYEKKHENLKSVRKMVSAKASADSTKMRAPLSLICERKIKYRTIKGQVETTTKIHVQIMQ